MEEEWFKKKILKIQDWLDEHPSLKYDEWCRIMDEKEGEPVAKSTNTGKGLNERNHN